MKRVTTMVLAIGTMFATACGDGTETGDPDPDEIPSYEVSGTVVDFVTGEAIEGVATVSTRNLTPPPSITVNGASFSLSGIPPSSVFNMLVGSPPEYQNTYAVAIEVLDDDVVGVDTAALSTAYVQSLATAFGVTPSAAGAILVARVVDANGAPRAGIGAEAFEIDNATPASGPFFLDADRQPAANLMETSASGYAVFFEVAPGLATINAAAASGYTMEMSASPTAGATVTLAEVITTDGAAELPTNVSFANDIVPLFLRRRCEACHSGGGIGKDLGNLSLDASQNKIFAEVTQELSPNYNIRRVNLETPETSLILTLPSAEDPPDSHPNVTFTGPSDPDYQMLLVWIREGAKQN
jgi:hypothetical protein